MFSLIDRVVRVLETLATAVTDQTRKERLTCELTEGAIACQACSRLADQRKTTATNGLCLFAEQVDSDLAGCFRIGCSALSIQ